MDTRLPITQVTVFADRAHVVRSGTVTLHRDDPRVDVTALSSSLVPETVRVDGRGDGVRLLGVQTTYAFVPTAPNDASALRQAVAEAEDTLAELSAADERLNGQAATWSAYARAAATSIGKRSGKVTAAPPASGGAEPGHQIETLNAEVIARLQSIDAERLDQSRRIRDARRRLAQAKAALEQANPSGDTRASVAIDFDLSETAGDTVTVSIELTYNVFGAGWRPIHDIHLTGDEVRVELAALVHQNTGEDWSDVAFELSTAQPGVSAELPEPTPWRIGPTPPPMPWRARSVTGEVPVAAPMAAMAASADEAVFKQAEFSQIDVAIDSSSIATTYRPSGTANVPPDGTEHRVFLGSADFDAAIDRVTAPYLGPAVYVRARLTNTSDLVMMAGEASIFHDGQYVGSTHVSTMVPTEEVELSLGIDEAVTAERKLVDRTASSSLTGGRHRSVSTFVTALANRRSTPVGVEVIDRVPLSDHAEVHVRVEEATPAPTEVEDLGIVRWRLEVPPGKTAESLLRFSVVAPKNMRIYGLE